MIKIIKQPKFFPDTVAFECMMCGCEFTAERADLMSAVKTFNGERIAVCGCPVCKTTCHSILAF